MENVDANSTGRRREGLLAIVLPGMASAALLLALPPISQSQSYHGFVDQRSWLGMANTLNVLSNIPFLLVGVAGLLVLLNSRRGEKGAFSHPREKWAYAILFLGIALTTFGSGYYHLEPSNGRLVWDRLPMTLGFMSLFAAVIAERVNLKAGLILLVPLVALGLLSVVYWHASELRGAGDLRPYIAVQFFPMVSIPLMAILYRSRYTRGADIFGAVAFYVAAKLLELGDGAIFSLGGVVSGHTLKHVAAAAAGYWILRMLKKRQPAQEVS